MHSEPMETIDYCEDGVSGLVLRLVLAKFFFF